MNNDKNVTTTSDSDVVNIVSLPEDCVSKIISFTSPLDACRFSLVSPHLISATDSDLVWRTFLPSDYHHILSRSHSPAIIINHPFKQLFRTLCHPLLLDGGNKSFKLEKCSGKKSYFLSARELSIIPRSNDTLFWCWKSNPQSRFSEVAELRTANWLEIEGKIRTGVLTQKTSYAAYLVINIVSDDTCRAYGLDYAPSEVSIAIGNKLLHTKKAYLRDKDEKKHKMETLFYGNRRNIINNNRSVVQEEIPRPSKREDGWMEIELGEFFSGEEEEDDQEIKMKLTEMGYQLKGGLIVEGMEVRPKTQIKYFSTSS